LLDYGLSFSAEMNPRKEPISNADNLSKGLLLLKLLALEKGPKWFEL